MKAKSVNEAIDFKRTGNTKSGLDVGRDRSDNPDNYANGSSYLNAKTNEEFLNGIIDELNEFHMALSNDINPMDDEGNYIDNRIAKLNTIRSQFHSIENAIDGLISFLKTIKR